MCTLRHMYAIDLPIKKQQAAWQETWGEKKSTYQFEVLNATNEVGSVGPPTFNVHTICKGDEKERQKHGLKKIKKRMFTLWRS